MLHCEDDWNGPLGIRSVQIEATQSKAENLKEPGRLPSGLFYGKEVSFYLA